MKIFGIKTCDACRKARRWLDEQGIGYEWVDLRDDGVNGTDLRRWLDAVDPDALVNRRSTTWRRLTGDERPAMVAEEVVPALEAHPTLIKRPVFEHAGDVRVGFTPAVRDWLAAR